MCYDYLEGRVDSYLVFKQLGIAFLLGLLVGIQREHVATRVAGMRTFPLITVLGAVAALLGQTFGGWIVAAGFLAVLTIVVLTDFVKSAEPLTDRGTTTHVAAVLMYGVGALTVVGPTAAAVAIGGGVAALLEFKGQLHGFVRRLGDNDVKAIMQFALLTLVILPVLPNETYGPLGVFNPFKTWLLVVLIVGMSLGGYIAYKFLGQRAGILLGGLLGGAISSTATTVSYARQAREAANGVRPAAIVIMLASAVVFLRLIVLVAVVGWESPGFLAQTIPPLAILGVLSFIPVAGAWRQARREPSEMPEPSNPTQLKSAILFAVMFAVVLLALAAARRFFGQFGQPAMMAVAALSGLTDMDAITLSTAEMQKTDAALVETGWRLIVIGAIANLVFKAGVAAALGNRRLFRQVALLFAVPTLGGIALLALW